MTDRIGYQYDQNGQKAIIQTAVTNVAAGTTDQVLVPADANGRRIVVLGIHAQAGGTATAVTLNTKGSSAGTPISSLKALAANGAWAQQRGNLVDYLFQTKRGEALTVTTGAGATVGIDIQYCVLD